MKLNFITDQGSIRDSTSWARRVGAVAGELLVPARAAIPGAVRTDGRGITGRAGRFGLTLGLVRAANGAATLAAMLGPGAGGTWAGSGGTGVRGGVVIPSPLATVSVAAGLYGI